MGSGGITVNSSSVFTFAGTENLTITADLVGSSDIVSMVDTPSGTSGTTRGIFIQQANHASNTNGLDVGLLFDNADADLAFVDGIVFTDSGGGGFTNFLNTPTIDITGAGAITGATAITSSGTITFSGFSNNNGVLYTNGSGVLAQTATGGAGALCLVSTNGGTPAFGSCSGSASTVWSALTNPTTSLSLAFDDT